MVDDATYLEHRALVLRIAYDITASWVEAEDIAQHTYLRWTSATTRVDNSRAYLARIATNLALDAVARREREGYRGTYLPEPVATGPGSPEFLEQAAEIEIALMVVLGTLTPLERAAFLLRDVFAFEYGEIATMLSRTQPAVRQLVSRARAHVKSGAPQTTPSSHAELHRLTAAFVEAAQHGNMQGLHEYLGVDVVFVGDGGGKRAAVLHPVRGIEKVAQLVLGIARQTTSGTRMVPCAANHRPALAIFEGEELDMMMWVVAAEGHIKQILVVRNPDKLQGISNHVSRC